jgi:hypothetical protein
MGLSLIIPLKNQEVPDNVKLVQGFTPWRQFFRRTTITNLVLYG